MRRAARGLTLIELLVGMVILAVLLALVVPSFRSVMGERALAGAANELSTDLQYARATAVAGNQNVTVATTSASGYTITGAQTLKTVALRSELSLNHPTTVTFNALRGCPTATCTSGSATLTLSSSQVSATAQVATNNMGRVQLCSPSGTLRGMPAC